MKPYIFIFICWVLAGALSAQTSTNSRLNSQEELIPHSPIDYYPISETMPFLRLPVSAETYMMGMTGASRVSDDPMATAINPAQLGMQSMKINVAAGYNFFDTPSSPLTIWHKSMAATAGFKLKDFTSSNIPLSFGIGYNNIYNQWTTIGISTVQHPEGIGFVRPYEKANLYSFGIGLNYTIKLAAGFTYKRTENDFPTKLKRDLYDFGFIAKIPLHEIFDWRLIKRLSGESGFTCFSNINLGYSRNNLGLDAVKEETFIPVFGPPQSGTTYVPSSVQTGYAVDLGINLRINETELTLLQLTYALEVKDMLAYMRNDHLVKHQGIMGDIDFFEDIVLGKTNTSTSKHKGFRVEFGETFSLLHGRTEGFYYPAIPENISGWIVNSKGIIKAANILFPELKDSRLGYILNHFSLQYCKGTTEYVNWPEIYSLFPKIRDRKFYSVNISWSNR